MKIPQNLPAFKKLIKDKIKEVDSGLNNHLKINGSKTVSSSCTQCMKFVAAKNSLEEVYNSLSKRTVFLTTEISDI